MHTKRVSNIYTYNTKRVSNIHLRYQTCLKHYRHVYLKHPGQHRTVPSTCSAVFWNQWPRAYSYTWNHTMGPLPLGWIRPHTAPTDLSLWR